MYGSRFHDDRKPVQGREVVIAGLPTPAVVNSDGMHLYGKDGKKARWVMWVWSCGCGCSFVIPLQTSKWA